MVGSIRYAEIARRCFTSRQVSEGRASRSSAMAPLVEGAAEEVPLKLLV